VKIGIIGAGQIGGTLTRRLTALGHDVAGANSRGPESLADLAAETGAKPVSAQDAAKFGEIVVSDRTLKVKAETRGRHPMFKESAKLLVWLIPVLLLGVIFLPQMIRILREYERGVIFRLGKLLGTKGPGLIFLIPIVDRMVRMDLRVVTINVARQEVMTRDNVPMTVDAVVYFRVIDPAAAVVRVEN
jgi:SPFH domain / Band 7 family/NADP oxidoreductase coenzyme F420-dependent